MFTRPSHASIISLSLLVTVACSSGSAPPPQEPVAPEGAGAESAPREEAQPVAEATAPERPEAQADAGAALQEAAAVLIESAGRMSDEERAARKPDWEKAKNALEAECDGATGIKKKACGGLIFGMLGAVFIPPDAAEQHAERVAVCEKEGNCGPATLAAYWGVPPLTKPEPEAALRHAQTGCKKTRDEELCAMAELLPRVRDVLRSQGL
jgi:hypothetical protein